MATPARPPRRVEREVALVTNPLHRGVVVRTEDSAPRHGRTRSSAPPVTNASGLYTPHGHTGAGGASGSGGGAAAGGHGDSSTGDNSFQALVPGKPKRPSFLTRVGASARDKLFTFKQVKRWRNRSRNRHLTKNSGVPLREGLQILYRIRRAKFLCELVVFVAFFVSFLLVVYEAYNVHNSWSQDSAVMDLFLDEEFEGASYKKNFHDIMTQDEFWQWANGPLVSGLYPETYYNGVDLPPDKEGYILGVLRLVGGVELRQMRVSNSSCSERRYSQFGQRFDTKSGSCYAEFELESSVEPWIKSTEDTNPFGPPDDPTKYKYVGDLGSEVEGLWGFGPGSYGYGGYPVYLPPQGKANATAMLNQLFQDRWVDEGTRAVAVTFSVYNTNSRLLTVARFLVEFFSTSDVQPSWEIGSARLILYESRTAQGRLIGELCCALIFLYMMQKEFRHMLATHPRTLYFFRFRSWFEIAFGTGVVLSATYWITYILSTKRRSFDVNTSGYVDYIDLSETFSMTFTFAGFTCLLMCLKLFKYGSINKRMNTMWLTLQRASQDLFMFGLGSMVILVGFSLTGNLIFGAQLRDFHNFASSVSTLSRFTLGDFNYQDLALARPKIAFIFFWMFNIVVFILILNMFIAIINKYFEVVHAETRAAEGWKHGMTDLSFDLIKEVRRLARYYCTGRCPKLWFFVCCKCWRSKLRRLRASKQLEVWQAEAELVTAFRRAARTAKRRDRSIDMYQYFERAYREYRDDANIFIGLPELCTITRNTAVKDACTHEDCVARAVVQSYTNLKHVTLVHGVERTTGKVNINRLAEYLPQRWEVVKINKWGRKQERVLHIDRKQKEIHSFDRHGVLKRALPLSDLLQLEKSLVDHVRLRLVFAELLRTQYNLLFNTKGERQTFCDALLSVLADVDTSESKRSDPARAARAAGPGGTALSDKIAGLQSGQFDMRRDIRIMAEELAAVSQNIGAVFKKVTGKQPRKSLYESRIHQSNGGGHTAAHHAGGGTLAASVPVAGVMRSHSARNSITEKTMPPQPTRGPSVRFSPSMARNSRTHTGASDSGNALQQGESRPSSSYHRRRSVTPPV